jgi:hypothetical protein
MNISGDLVLGWRNGNARLKGEICDFCCQPTTHEAVLRIRIQHRFVFIRGCQRTGLTTGVNRGLYVLGVCRH